MHSLLKVKGQRHGSSVISGWPPAEVALIINYRLKLGLKLGLPLLPSFLCVINCLLGTCMASAKGISLCFAYTRIT
jgi:hypothetical protein